LAHRIYLEHLGTTAEDAEAMLRKFHAEVADRFDGRPGVALEML
jgi:hypothetical protein